MTEQPETSPHLRLRASDADRERVAKVLHDAMADGRLTLAELDERLQAVYAAKTLGELVPVTEDLPNTESPVVPGPAPLPQRRTASALSPRIGGEPDSSVLFAMLGGFERKGDWVVPRFLSATAIMAGGDLDLTHARFAEPECTIQCFALMAGIEITVPHDVTVKVQGIGVMGAFEQPRGTSVGDPDGPVLRVTGLALMGGVEIKRPKFSRKRLRRGD